MSDWDTDPSNQSSEAVEEICKEYKELSLSVEKLSTR